MRRVKPVKPKTVRIWTVDILRRAWGDHYEAPAKARDRMREEGELLANIFHYKAELGAAGMSLRNIDDFYFGAEYRAMEAEFLRIINGQPRRRRTWEWKQ